MASDVYADLPVEEEDEEVEDKEPSIENKDLPMEKGRNKNTEWTND